MAAGLPTDGWKRSPEDYMKASEYLLESLKSHGFRADEPIPIDKNGELLGGAHRVACACALGINVVSVVQRNTEVWAPPWNREWFVERGMHVEDLQRLDRDMEIMAGV